MSVQTTVSRAAQGTHHGLLGAGILAIAAALVGLALAAALLASGPKAPTSRPVPPFNAPAFRAEEHHLRAPLFDAPAFRAAEHHLPAAAFGATRPGAEARQPLADGAPAAQHEPFPWNR